MPKQSYTGKLTGKIIACRPDRERQQYRVRVMVDGTTLIRDAVTPYVKRIGQTVVIAGDGSKE